VAKIVIPFFRNAIINKSVNGDTLNLKREVKLIFFWY